MEAPIATPKPSLGDVLDAFQLQEADVVALFQFGSRVYGTSDHLSDWDFVIVLDKVADLREDSRKGSIPHIEGVFFGREGFIKAIQECSIVALECLWLPPAMRQVERENFLPFFRHDLSVLRDSLSAKAAHSWSKAGKKCSVAHEFRISKKSLWHSFRILDLGMQIAEHGKIVSYSSPAVLAIWQDISQDASTDWAHYKDKYQPLYKKAKSAFRLVAPLQSRGGEDDVGE